MSIANIPPSTLLLARPGDRRESSSIVRRLVGGLVAAGAGALLGVAASLTPSSSGVGTHLALGLPKCGWIAMADMPCPTCGMTTAFAHAAHGELGASFLAQPMGFLLALATAMIFLVGAYVAATGSRLGGALLRLWSARMTWGLVVLVLAAWGFKILSYKGLL